MASPRTIVVAGAGIGGLTAALALAEKGFRIVVLEQAERLQEAGAGLQLSPNASRILIELGLRERLAALALTPEAISIMSARSGGEIARLPLADSAGAAPYWVLHRADLQSALQARVNEVPEIELRLGCRFEDAAGCASGVSVIYRRGARREQEAASALIGADGVWSAVRKRVFPRMQPQFSGLIAWRGMSATKQLPQQAVSRRVQLWMGPNAHLVTYPVSGGRQTNVVAIIPGAAEISGTDNEGDAGEIAKAFSSARWPVSARMVIGAVEGWRKWALFTVPQGADWSSGPVALLGDAAHAMLPFAAQGAAMAIEDAAVLAKSLSGCDNADAFAAALQRYGRSRGARVARVQRAARLNGKIYHLGGAAAFARDVFIRGMGAERLLARQQWIYGWRP